jgi:hypothetical protein
MVFVIFWFYVVYNDNFILWTPRSGVGTPFYTKCAADCAVGTTWMGGDVFGDF